MIWYLLIFLLLAAAARGLYLRERRRAMRLQMAVIRESMTQYRAELREAAEEADAALSERRPENV